MNQRVEEMKRQVYSVEERHRVDMDKLQEACHAEKYEADEWWVNKLLSSRDDPSFHV